MNQTLDTIRQVNDLLAAIARVDRSTMTDADLCLLVAAEEETGRLTSASQCQSAAEIDDRSRFELGGDGLSMRNSFRKTVPFLEHLTRASQSDLAGRVRLGQAVRARVSLTGKILPATFPFVAEGLKSGQIARVDAMTIVRTLEQAETGSKASLDNMDAAEQALAELAAVCFSDVVRSAAQGWRDALDPDGIEPRYDEILGLRTLRKGGERNGITNWSLKTDPKTTALLDAVLEESTAPGTVPRFMGEEDRRVGTKVIVDDLGNDIQVMVDRRSRDQKQLDTLVGVVTAGLRASHDAAPDLRATGQVIATVTLAELEAGVGTAWLVGANEPIPIAAVEKMICDSGLRIMVLGKNGKPLGDLKPLGKPVIDRYFTPKQRGAMLVRDGDRCVGPGCQTPAAWSDAHHVQFHETGGPTALDNGVLLCGACHGALHKGAFEIRMIDGIPHTRLSIQSGDDSAWRRAGTARHFGKAA
jgi:hypothetical protein